MNRQLVAFLSLFSLVLVLSVYYVMMPSTTTQLKENAQNVNLNVKDATTLYFESLDLERDNAHQEYIDEMIKVYEGLNQEYTLEEAFYNINNRNNIIEEEKKIEECIKSLGFTSCYAEVEGDDYIKVIVYSTTKSLLEVDQIMYQVQLLLEREVSTFIVEFQE
ncbi:MAG: hypothetical protein E7180_00540 [Erysipelotrichaceae bacterium]|nr:hypothetical protein [Erysipelotrichaceae bacterium]